MHLIKKFIVIIAFACVASFAQQSSTSKTVSQGASPVITVAKVDTQKQLKNLSTKTTNTTWTKIKDLFM